MLGIARENMQLAVHAPAEDGLRQHAFDSELDDALGVLLEEFAEGDGLDATDRTGVVVVDLVGHLRARDADLPGVQHDDVVAHVDVRAVVSLVLALEAQRDLRGEPTERFTRGIDDKPVSPHGGGLGENSAHIWISARDGPEYPVATSPEKGCEVYSSRAGFAKPPAKAHSGPDRRPACPRCGRMM